MKLIRASLLLVASVISWSGAAAAAPIDVTNPPSGRFSDEWSEVYLGSGKVGYLHATMARQDNLIHTYSFTKMRIGRAAMPVTIETTQTTTETLDGAIVSFSSEMAASIMKTSMRGTVKDGRVTIVTSQYGMEQTRTFDVPTGAVMTWGMFREAALRGFAPGTKYTLAAYTPDLRLDDAVSATTVVGESEEFDYHGQRRRGRRVDVTLDSPIGSLTVSSWVDKDGWPLRAEVPMAGIGNIIILATDQATALADFIPPEVFMKTVIDAKRRIDRKASWRITYRIRPTAPDVDLASLPTTGMQSPTPKADGSVELVITRQKHATPEPRASARANSAKTPTPPVEDLAEFVESNLMINMEDPELIKLAKRAAGDTTDPYLLADKLRRFVTDYVKTKSLNIGFATASEVCRTREGDCSEHGVLLAALGRLSGLPSRVAVGVAYVESFGGRSDVFGYHMWTQFYIEGRWLDFDAALRESICSPTRIAFATSSLKNTGLADLSLPLISKIGAIEIDIIEVEEFPRATDR